MKTIIITILAVVLVIGGYIFIQDRKIKAELSKVEESKEVESNTTATTTEADSEITITRTNGVWSVNSDGAYTIDSSSLKFEFTGYKPGGQHAGTFNNLNATISLNETGNPLVSKITLDPASIKTDTEKLDEHLLAPEFFDTAKYPNISIEVKEIQKNGENIKAITDLTLKGVTKTLAIPVKMLKTDNGIMFTVDTRIKISDYQMVYGPVQDEVRVTLSGVLRK